MKKIIFVFLFELQTIPMETDIEKKIHCQNAVQTNHAIIEKMAKIEIYINKLQERLPDNESQEINLIKDQIDDAKDQLQQLEKSLMQLSIHLKNDRVTKPVYSDSSDSSY